MKLDTEKIENSSKAAQKFTELFKGKDQNLCDSAYFIFNNFYGRLTSGFDNYRFKDTTVKYDSLLTDSNRKYLSKLSGNLAYYAQKLKDNGLRVYMSEGDTCIGQDLDFFAKWFYDDISPTMKEYLIQLNKDDKEGYAEDAGLTISPYQLADRTVWWEKFASKHPNCIVSDNSENNWKDYLGTILQGMDNSPVIDYDEIHNGQKSLNDYYKLAYGYIQASYPNTETNKLVSPYFKLLLQKDSNKADKLLKEYKKDGKI
ncbi:MAG TPA: hypothetical protein VGN20_01335 [Mucilaginibacter sp.]|jgi:hypothetical protein